MESIQISNDGQKVFAIACHFDSLDDHSDILIQLKLSGDENKKLEQIS